MHQSTRTILIYVLWGLVTTLTMKVSFLNLQRNIDKKIDIIETHLFKESISICGLSEIDLEENEKPPPIKGYVCISDSRPMQRVCTYVKDDIYFDQLTYDGDLPCTIISTSHTTFVMYIRNLRTNHIH